MATIVNEHEQLRAEAERLRRIVGTTVRTISRMVHENREPGDDPPILCGPAWFKVAYICGLGSTSASALCLEFGVDPEFVQKSEADDQVVPYEACDGTGTVEKTPALAGWSEHGDREQEACHECDGTGKAAP